MKSILIVNATIINENSRKIGDIFIKNGRIEQIADKLSHIQADTIIDATNKYVIPGMITKFRRTTIALIKSITLTS